MGGDGFFHDSLFGTAADENHLKVRQRFPDLKAAGNEVRKSFGVVTVVIHPPDKNPDIVGVNAGFSFEVGNLFLGQRPPRIKKSICIDSIVDNSDPVLRKADLIADDAGTFIRVGKPPVTLPGEKVFQCSHQNRWWMS